jgi:hypothetical protein
VAAVAPAAHSYTLMCDIHRAQAQKQQEKLADSDVAGEERAKTIVKENACMKVAMAAMEAVATDDNDKYADVDKC